MKKLIMLIMAFLIVMPLSAKEITVSDAIKSYFSKQLPSDSEVGKLITTNQSYTAIAQYCANGSCFSNIGPCLSSGNTINIRFMGTQDQYLTALQKIDEFFTTYLVNQYANVYIIRGDFQHEDVKLIKSLDPAKAQKYGLNNNNVFAIYQDIQNDPTSKTYGDSRKFLKYKVAEYKNPNYIATGQGKVFSGERPCVRVYYIPNE
jgi:hypothetical protein